MALSSGTQASTYAAIEFARDGRRVDIRALRPEDKDDLIAAYERVSSKTAYQRFFAVRHHFSEAEVAFFTEVDFASHVALAALVDEGGKPTIVGAGRYVAYAPGCAEMAFCIVDAYQGHGIGSALLRHIIAIAERAGLLELTAEVLADNAAMLAVFAQCIPPHSLRREGTVVHVIVHLAANRPAGNVARACNAGQSEHF